MPEASRAARRIAGVLDSRSIVIALVLLAFALRVLVRWFVGREMATGGYDFYARIAENVARGHGFCILPDQACARRMPLYPMLLVPLVPLVVQGGLPAGLVIIEAALGALTTCATYLIGRDLFGRRVGVWAAALAALSPYAVVHDTALQDTALVNVLVAMSVWLLVRLRRPGSSGIVVPLAAGVTLGLAVLTTARVALMVVASLAWVVGQPAISWRRRGRDALLVAIPIALLVTPWIVRNTRMVGAPVLTTEGGESLWAANNAETMAYIPERSIDGSVAAAYASLSADHRAELAAVRGDDVATDRLLGRWGRQFIQNHPWLTAERAIVKAGVPLVAYLSPRRGAVVQAGFAAIYLPLHVLAAIALWRRRRQWRAHLLPCVIVAAFLLTSAVFWAHTSHATCLDPLWFVYAASIAAAGGVEADAKILADHEAHSRHER